MDKFNNLSKVANDAAWNMISAEKLKREINFYLGFRFFNLMKFFLNIREEKTITIAMVNV